MSNEHWLPAPGYEGLYEVSNYGRVRSIDRVLPHPVCGFRRLKGRVLKRTRASNGYLNVGLHKDSRQRTELVHRLVCTAFHGPCPEGQETRHLDGDCLNNRADNLAWGTKSENTLDQVRHGTHRCLGRGVR